MYNVQGTKDNFQFEPKGFLKRVKIKITRFRNVKNQAQTYI